MVRISSLLLSIILALPLTGYAQNSEREYHIEKQKLICLHKRVDDLLRRRADPVMVVLERECADSQADGGGDRVRGGITLPILVPNVPPPSGPRPSDGTITSTDVLMLTHEQLQCFKREFNKLIKDNKRDPIPIHFGRICKNQ